MAKKQSSSALSSLAAKIVAGTHTPTPAEIKKLAASVLSQDETPKKKKPLTAS